MVDRAAGYYDGNAGSRGRQSDERMMVFIVSYSALYDFLMASMNGSMKEPLADGRREAYCLNAAGGHNGSTSARLAGYSANSPQNAFVMSWYLLKRQDVRDRIAWLRAQATDDAILTLVQMKIVLSEIASARLSDYQGSDGKFHPLDDDTPNPSAVAQVTYGFDPIKRQPYVASLSLRDPLSAIAELCRLEGAYKKPGTNVTVAPIVSVDQVRAKMLAKLDAVGEHQTDNTIEESDMDSELEDGCSEEQHSNNLEV